MRDPHRWANDWALVSRPRRALARVALGGHRPQCGPPSCLNLLGRSGCRVWRGCWPCFGTRMCGRSKRSRERVRAGLALRGWRVEAEDWQRLLALNRQWRSDANGRLNRVSSSRGRGAQRRRGDRRQGCGADRREHSSGDHGRRGTQPISLYSQSTRSGRRVNTPNPASVPW